MTDLEAAWAAVHEDTPEGWSGAKPGFEEPHPHYLVMVSDGRRVVSL